MVTDETFDEKPGEKESFVRVNDTVDSSMDIVVNGKSRIDNDETTDGSPSGKNGKVCYNLLISKQ